MGYASHIRDEIDRLQDEVDELASAAALVQQTINEKALDLLVGAVEDQGERIHELQAHIGTFGACFISECVDARRLVAQARKAATT